jgi:hypothetical protein
MLHYEGLFAFGSQCSAVRQNVSATVQKKLGTEIARQSLILIPILIFVEGVELGFEVLGDDMALDF